MNDLGRDNENPVTVSMRQVKLPEMKRGDKGNFTYQSIFFVPGLLLSCCIW